MRYTEVCNVKISEGRQGKIDNAEMQETCYTFAEKLGGNDMNEKQELVIRTLSYLEEHLQETLSLQAVARLMQYSPYYLHRSFTQMHLYWKSPYPTVMKAHRHFLRPLSSYIR